MSSQWIPDLAREQSYPVPFKNSALFPLLLLSLATQRIAPKTKKTFKKEYDYIVVGSGAAGAVVASRLSEKSCVNVLLLEAGKSAPYVTEIPGLTRMFEKSDLDWKYNTVPQNHTARILEDRKMQWPCGKAIGGSTILNNALYIRGSAEVFDKWEQQGAVGWSYKKILKYFIKAEANTDKKFIRNGFHGTNGPMTVSRYPTRSEFIYPTLRAEKNLGYPFVDPNGLTQIGISDYQGNIRGGQRCSTAKGYLVPAEDRENLDIVAEAFVKKIIIKKNRAVGVLFDFNGTERKVNAKNEVILSAGAVNSVQLLMLSGIGPGKTLEKNRIRVLADLPVGLNFHDHVGAFSLFNVKSDIPNFTKKLEDNNNIREYINNRTGILASTAGVFGMGFLKDDQRKHTSNVPDFELYYLEVPESYNGSLLRISKPIFKKYFGPYENKTNIYCVSQLVQPRSRGTVTIQSNNPYDSPLIDPNFLADQEDVRDVVAGLKVCHKIFTHPELKRLGVRPFATVIPGCESSAHDQDKYYECVARSFTESFYHSAGTAKMGSIDDPTTVVDPQLRVKGIDGLRVVDGSVMPIVPSGNSAAVVVMIGEKASDMIKETIRC